MQYAGGGGSPTPASSGQCVSVQKLRWDSRKVAGVWAEAMWERRWFVSSGAEFAGNGGGGGCLGGRALGQRSFYRREREGEGDLAVLGNAWGWVIWPGRHGGTATAGGDAVWLRGGL